MSKLALRSETHSMRLASSKDFWYSGGGAFQEATFGYTGRPSSGGGTRGLANVWDLSADYQFTRMFAATVYYGKAWGKTVIATIYPKDPNAQLLFLETNFRLLARSCFGARLHLQRVSLYHLVMPVETEIQIPTSIRAPRGNQISCKGWQQEAAMRMLMNNLDDEVAERPKDLVVYGGTGRAARSWEAYRAIVATLKTLDNDETLLVQSGKPVGVFKTHDHAPRVLIANSNLVGHWSNWEKFNELERAGPDDVRPDDRRIVDLHRLPRHCSGNIRNIFRRR